MRRAYRTSFDVLAHALTQCHADRISAALVLAGDPGGVIHFRDGAVIAAHSPGAPGVAALRAGAAGQSELIGAAIADAAFAIAVGSVSHYVLDDTADVLPPVVDGVSPALLLGQVAVRLAVLDASPCPVSPYRERLVATGHGDPDDELQEIVTHATGRRTARDIAFAIGRGVHSVTVDVARMLGDDVLAIAPAAAFTGRVHVTTATLRPREATPQTAVVESADLLPVRRPGDARPGPGP
ncbi:hypothetical protein [Kutzneria sp. CA-103260]|uniref:hypothetical protein n=1 Tax=Kutzneria sp. CA-103260 TaxID=2802641 RepID=UPI001BA7311D|nr:hypothetical protein [Kutzneria sp. CA-103260]QUQ69367.1 hypothetical protein JJ691_71250 [Kutzneria sp. CA-103260]